ncbi:hypothetical protein HF086_004621 [Spodoptera exigua]|uniref:Uncharacterized protein n=1 Tax=Spodoptera exigua TaxID=7107 RepID=A0A922SBJ9_SPOEX|nr:hypothetical protein HF086_004621 [Spodoptera exigua]
MGKKKERCSKRKRRACLLEKCANMTKKKKQSLEQCSENETMESSTSLGIWYGNNKIETEIIKKDDAFWKKDMEPKLLKFYYDCLLPELVDPRHTRNKPIRDPDYVIVHNNKNSVPDTCNEQLEKATGSGKENADSNQQSVAEYEDVFSFSEF